ncbi:MAG: ANTAR domain-containing protein [Actinomycetota bacterium]|nr:ANTAR domain-containing protein [Actinomycetota bacterium]
MLVGQLQAALRSRIRLEQARGVLAERSGLQVDQASTLLNDYGRDHGLPLDEIVGAILDGSASGTATLRKAEALSDRDRDSLPLGAGSAAEPA